MSATDTPIQKKMYGSGTKTINFSNKDLEDMTKIVKALEDSNVLMKGITRTLKNDIKKGGGFPLIPIRFKTNQLRNDFNDAYIVVTGTTTATNPGNNINDYNKK